MEKFPVFSLLNRDQSAETSSPRTPPTAIESSGSETAPKHPAMVRENLAIPRGFGDWGRRNPKRRRVGIASDGVVGSRFLYRQFERFGMTAGATTSCRTERRPSSDDAAKGRAIGQHVPVLRRRIRCSGRGFDSRLHHHTSLSFQLLSGGQKRLHSTRTPPRRIDTTRAGSSDASTRLTDVRWSGLLRRARVGTGLGRVAVCGPATFVRG